jgi:hypothetical protein
MDAALRVTRIIHLSLFVAAVMYVFLAEQVRMQGAPLGNEIFWIIASMALVSSVAALIVRNKISGAAESGLRLQADDVLLISRWRMGYIIALALAESAVLYGFVVRVTGGTAAQAGLLYACGLAVMLMLTPRRP